MWVFDIGGGSIKAANENLLYYCENHHHISIASRKQNNAVSRPFERGCLVNVDLQKGILETFVKSLPTKDDFSELILIKKLLSPVTSHEFLQEILFEKLGFQTVFEISPQQAILQAHCATNKINDGILSVDLGFSFTEICPIFKKSFVNLKSLRRSSVGGKVVARFFERYEPNVYYTNKLYEQNLEETFLASSKYPNSCMLNGRKTEAINLKTLPEDTYFYPEIIGLDELGLKDLILNSIDTCPFNVRQQISRNIVLTGGSPYINNVNKLLSYFLGSGYCVKELDLSFAEKYKILQSDSKSENLSKQIFSKVIGASNVNKTDLTTQVTREQYLEGTLNR